MDYNAKIRNHDFYSKDLALAGISVHLLKEFGKINFLLNFFFFSAVLTFRKETKFESFYNIIKMDRTPHLVVAELLEMVLLLVYMGKPGYGHKSHVIPAFCLLQVTAEVGNFQSNQKVNEDVSSWPNIFIFNSLKPPLYI